ncbi:MAG: beta-glucosidase BglX [Bacteroidales bacterium]|nr:beta-glucosidase BglX [Bacteroidales bacterium]
MTVKRHSHFWAAAAAAALSVCACSNRGLAEREMDSFINSLMSRMTLEEKLGQMNLPSVPNTSVVTGNQQCENVLEDIRAGKVGAILNTYGYENVLLYQKTAVEESRLGIPLLVGLDVIHGHETVFPIPLGLACSWNPDDAQIAARISAIEATADGINWTFNPMVDIARDPRWGRCAEGFGEDPYLGSLFARSMVRGYQGAGDFSEDSNMLACLKHFALYGASESGRDYREVDMSPARMFNEYFPPYKAAVEEGVASVMTSFNDLNGCPSSANRWLLTEVLRNQWGFEGFVVSDYNAVGELVNHRAAGSKEEAAVMSLNAGLDMDMVTAGCLTLDKALERGEISIKQIDAACHRILEAKWKLGLFRDPYKYLDPSRKQRIYTAGNRAEARRIAASTFVLLKNGMAAGKQLLPLDKNLKLALVGPLADAGGQYPGCWAVAAKENYPSLLDEMRKMDEIRLSYAKGCNILDDEKLEKTVTPKNAARWNTRPLNDMISEAVAVAHNSDVVIAAMGEAANMSGESGSRTDISLPECQKKLLNALQATGKPIVLVLFSGRPMTLSWENENMTSILETWFGGSEAAGAITDVLFGKVNPSGKLTMSFPYSVGQIPVYYNMKNTGRDAYSKEYCRYASNWIDSPNEPLYPFGYGLSYTTFSYSPISLSDSVMTGNTPVKAKVTVCNAGKYDGHEVVQLYIRDVVSSETRPVKELKGFKRIFLKAGESTEVEFDIIPEMLGWYSVDQYNLAGSSKPLASKFVVEPGNFDIMIGPDSRDVQATRMRLQ